MTLFPFHWRRSSQQTFSPIFQAVLFQYLEKRSCKGRKIVVYSHSKVDRVIGEWVAAHSFFETISRDQGGCA